MRVLLTGGTGFVGGHAAEALAAAGHRVRALTRGRDDGGVLARAGAEAVAGRLEDAASLRAAVAGAEAVLHGAGLIKARRPSEYHEANAAGTLRLLDACAAASPPPRRFVLVSSLAAQGPSPRGRPLSESDPARPVSHYGASKARAERVARAFADRMEVVVVRPPAVYGPRDRETLEFFRIAARGLRPRMAGRDLRLSLVHATDLARGLVAAVEAPEAAGGVFHLCHPEVLALGEVLDRMAAALGRPGRALPIPRALLAAVAFASEHAASLADRVPALAVDKARELLRPAWVADPGRARRLLGWEARIPSAEGIPATARWYREAGWL
ncbi:MAG TPA: NAD(P)-dependent oxidoreductase [Planctomycetota bacterium]|nr:NAD(P)-dependent oxidoreductase [Planctomycetota bacterium]